MERMNVGLKRSQDDSPTIRDLLCVILQLVQGDPQVFLHVRFFFNWLTVVGMQTEAWNVFVSWDVEVALYSLLVY